VSTDPTRDCSELDECLGPMQCNDITHSCVGGPQLEDDSPCNDDSGTCIDGARVPIDCGNGEVDTGEECDEGEDNGVYGSGCSMVCESIICGNGEIEEFEDCDDGNTDRLDGCDPECRAELVHRITRMELLSGDAPDFCEHQENRFHKMHRTFSYDDYFSINLLASYNGQLNTLISNGEKNYLLHIFDSQDTSLTTSDAEISIGIYEGIPSQDWEEGPPLDFPFSVNPDHLDEHRIPIQYHSIPAEQSGGGQVASTMLNTVDISGIDIFEVGRIFDFQMRMTFDKLSAPPEPPTFHDGVIVPEYHGRDEPDADPYQPQGILCGAIRGEDFRTVPANPICCKSQNTNYRECENGIVTDECDSMADVYLGGCFICFSSNPLSDVFHCSLDGYCSSLIVSAPYDVDTDGDEINDAWSVAYAFEGKRVSVRQ